MSFGSDAAAPGAVLATDRADVAPEVPAALTGPARTRDTACASATAARSPRTRRPRRRDGWTPGITEAVERQKRAMRELSRRAFPEPDVVPDDAPAPI